MYFSCVLSATTLMDAAIKSAPFDLNPEVATNQS
jgi:hypothetical protein